MCGPKGLAEAFGIDPYTSKEDPRSDT